MIPSYFSFPGLNAIGKMKKTEKFWKLFLIPLKILTFLSLIKHFTFVKYFFYFLRLKPPKCTCILNRLCGLYCKDLNTFYLQSIKLHRFLHSYMFSCIETVCSGVTLSKQTSTVSHSIF